MKDLPEARNQNGLIYLNGWTRWLVSALWGILVTAMLMLANNVIANDKKATDSINENRTDIRELQANYNSIKEDLIEIKQILKRKIP